MYFYLRNVSEFFICMYDSSFLPENCYGRTEVCSMTLKDIADLAGVSMMTVSNVINGKTSRVSQKTRDKVNAIIEEYGYVPNLNARSLSNKNPISSASSFPSMKKMCSWEPTILRTLMSAP